MVVISIDGILWALFAWGVGYLVFGAILSCIGTNIDQSRRGRESAPRIQKEKEDRERRRMEQFLTGQELD